MKNKILLPLMGVALITACASKPEGELTGTVGELYNNGLSELKKGKYSAATHSFEELERQYPYSGWAIRAEMMGVYTHYKAGEYDEAAASADAFIKMHPGHKDLPYIYYLKGMSYYARIRDVTRDQGHTQNALNAFDEVVNRYPDSDYARDAKLKATLCRDHLAGGEMQVGRYYQGKGQYLAAINRYQTVVDQYQTTSQAPEALYRLIESNLAIGLNDEAKRAGAILGYNYPASMWYEQAYTLLTKAKLAPAGQKKVWYQQIYKGLKQIAK
ncbi:MAG TPA: outer membrane protein assembly factor BamD [Alphaproteobacteria bacterium]|nr:outer membrane protein assembly factor BamD [Alphaproteobacteria bacterium]